MWHNVALVIIISAFKYGVCLRCFSDHDGPNTRAGIENCDGAAVCSQSRIVFREGGVLKVARGNQCKEPTRIEQRSNDGWPWCSEEWTGSDEGGMEVLTCYCKTDLCNNHKFQSEEFLIWIMATKERLKAGNANILDIIFNLATGGVILFFVAVLWSNLPQSLKEKIFFFTGKTGTTEDFSDVEEEEIKEEEEIREGKEIKED